MSHDTRVPSYYHEAAPAADMYRFACKGKDPPYYQLFGDQAAEIAREYMHTAALVKQAGNVPYLTISDKLFRQIAWDLLRSKGKKVELYESVGNDWKCTLQASPGRLEQFEARYGQVAQGADAGCIVSVHFRVDPAGIVHVGCAYANQTLRVIGVAEFADASATFSNIESFLLQIGAREAVLPGRTAKKAAGGGDRDAKERVADDEEVAAKLADVISHTNVHVERDPLKKCRVDELSDRLRFLLREEHLVHEALQMDLAAKSLAGLIGYLDLTAESCNEQQFTLRKEDLSKYLKLDCAAVRALNLFDDEVDGRGKASLLGYLDRCQTAMGKRQLKMWVTQPLLDLDAITRRQDIVECFVDDAMLRDALSTSILKSTPDLDKILKRVQRMRASLHDCRKIGDFTGLVPKILCLMENYAGEHKHRIDEYIARLRDIQDTFEGLTALIQEAIEVDEHDKEARIRASFDEALDELNIRRNEVRQQINTEFARMLKDTSHTDKEIKLEHAANIGHHFRVTKKAMASVEKKKDVIAIETRSDGMKFTTPNLTRINTTWRQFSEEYDERQTLLVQQFKETIASYLEPLDDVCALIAELDIFVAFATVSSDARSSSKQFVRPVIHPMPAPSNGLKRLFRITAGRHPLVEAQLMKHGGGEFVSNDLELKDATDAPLMALITGPNMGGKSTFIRTAGVCTLLAQIGMFVPCDAMELTLVDAVLARLGAADYMSRGVSTFMAEMLETNTILANATSNSFVIIDELGRGTSTHDGYGLAWGIAEHLVTKTRCCTLFATHFHELTTMATELKHVTNLHVTADTSGDELRMLYEVHAGACSKSYGINVAQITRFPPPVIAAAKRKTEMLESMSSKRRRVHTDEECDQYLIDWLGRFTALPVDAGSFEAYKSLVADFDAHTKTFPQLQQLTNAAGHAKPDAEGEDMVLG